MEFSSHRKDQGGEIAYEIGLMATSPDPKPAPHPSREGAFFF